MIKSAILISASLALILASCLATSNILPDGDGPQVTTTLSAWLSSQCEKIIEEMEALAKYNSQSDGFSVVSYLRYLVLYDGLTTVAKHLDWVDRKARAFRKVNAAAEQIVSNYLKDLDNALYKIESNEPKSKQNKVDDNWLTTYKTIRYISTHVSDKNSLVDFLFYELNR